MLQHRLLLIYTLLDSRVLELGEEEIRIAFPSPGMSLW